MKFCLISFGNYDHDGRLRNLLRIFSGLGELYAVTRGRQAFNEHSIALSSIYPVFIYCAVRFAERHKGFDFLVIDNRKAAVPGLILTQAMRKYLQGGGGNIRLQRALLSGKCEAPCW